MKKLILHFASLLIFIFCSSLIMRHDVPDEKFIELAKKFPQVCHFPMGEGCLVDKHWVLTAGHVGSDLKRDVQNGYTPEVVCNGKKYAIEKVEVHPDFKTMEQGLDNDIALVRLKDAVTDVQPVKFYSKSDEAGKEITIVGMGDMGTGLTGPQKWDKITRAATNTIDSVDDHWIAFDFDSPETPGVTAMEGISGPGDSGGPALILSGSDIYIAGISSWQEGQARFGIGHYGVTEHYARVSSYFQWITSRIEK